MPLGLYSLDARIELAGRARSSLDAQYYLLAADRSGRLFLRSLRDAALRGVRVRLLVDDLNTYGTDSFLAGLAAFPGVEVRLFNPFCCARGALAIRFAGSLLDARRLHRRMHNKLFVADGAFAVMGGRNIADEYFARGAVSNFVDMDLLVAGPAVDHLARIFDDYWNSAQAYAVESIVPEPRGEEARALFNHLVEDGEQMTVVTVPPLDPLAQSPLAAELDAGQITLRQGKAVVFADRPRKVVATSAENARALSVQMNILGRVVASRRRVVISSPYFVPGRAAAEDLADLATRGVEVAILTNSLAANDEPLTHAGYARYRAALLRAGVQLYELRPRGFRRRVWDAIPGLSLGRLHAKVAVMDESTVYIGSMNMDPRSESSNTELGLVVQSAELARDVLRVLDATTRQDAYSVRFAADGRNLEWVAAAEPGAPVLVSEPEVHPWARFCNELIGLFVAEWLL